MTTPSREFRLIHDYFSGHQACPRELVVPIGDDAAVIDWDASGQLVVCSDTLNQGIHFPDTTLPYDIAWKALAVNISDLAAMGATPVYFTLSLSLPAADATWLSSFSEGLFAAAGEFNIILVGGDTTRGPLSVAVTAIGSVAPAQAVRRCGASVGDGIYVTGSLGEAAAALALLSRGEVAGNDHRPYLMQRLNRPLPRLAWGQLLAAHASAMIDISDGLCADLGHILQQSGVGARVEIARLPLSASLNACVDKAEARSCALTGGDDYELCLTVAAEREQALAVTGRENDIVLTRIGSIESEPGLRLLDDQGAVISMDRQGWDHFA